jgi:hypothetical protein
MGINVFAPVAVILTAKQRALQNGTPKALPNGEARACYAMLSYNTSSGVGGLAFYDKFFQPVRASTAPHSLTSLGALGNYHHSTSGDAQTNLGLFGGNVNTTSAQSATNASATYLNSSVAGGEFGNAFIDAFSNSSASPQTSRNSTWATKHYLNQMFVDSDHSDKSIIYVLGNGLFRAVSRIDGDSGYDYYGTTATSITGLNASMWGSGSYNSVRKELVILSYAGAGGSFTLMTYQGVDFNKYKSPAEALVAPGVVRIDKAVSFAANWSAANNESNFNIKPTLCDNGDVYVTCMFESSSLSLWRVVRDASLSPTVTYISAKGTTTSYGRSQGDHYGQRRIQARDGGAVMAFCPYYYYGAGLRTWLIDKRKSTYLNASMIDSTDASAGTQPVPYGDSGFAAYFCGNVYASGTTGAYVTGSMERGGTGLIVQTGSNILLPYFTAPNTTNYPGFTQVTDYSMLDNQALV